jgi:RND superfamily putative drug exporter
LGARDAGAACRFLAMSFFARLARFVLRRPVTVVVVWIVAAIAMFAFSEVGWRDYGNLQDRTTTGAPGVMGSDSAIARIAAEDAVPFEAGTTLTAMLLGVDPTDPALAAALSGPLGAVAQTEGVALVASPVGVFPGPAFGDTLMGSGGGDPSALVAADGRGMTILVTIAPQSDDAAVLALDHTVSDQFTSEVIAAARAVSPEATMQTFSTSLLFEHFDIRVSQDLVIGEAIALPLALIVMVFVFGGFLAASMPIAGAIASIAGGFAILYGFTFPYTVDNSAQSVVTVLGIGLCIDYGLLIVSRYREELAAAQSPTDARQMDARRTDASEGAPGVGDARAWAIERAMATAGRTVFFSAVTVAIAVGGLLTFSPDLMKAFGGAALGVVVMALLVAMTLVPALAYLFGHRLMRPGLVSRVPGLRRVLRVTSDVTRDEGVFSRLTARVQRRPWLVVAGSLAVLGMLASPILGLQMRNSGLELLPHGDPVRTFIEDFDANFPLLRDPDVRLVAETSGPELQAWIDANLASRSGVVAVTPMKEANGLALSGLVVSFTDRSGADAVNLVKDIRALDPPFRLYVGGAAANQIDFIAAIADGAPFALGIVVLATFVLLFLMTGSILVPVKALAINALSLSASIGVAIWIFQEGHLEGPLQFVSTGGIETYVLVLILSFGFGLSMDYEVFLLSRIKELVDKGVPNDEAVRLGLQRSGRIITSAATIVIVVFMGFAAGRILVIKEIGVGLAFAVLLDATLVRLLLVPATMTLLGNWNWWAPKPLKRLYARMSVTH